MCIRDETGSFVLVCSSWFPTYFHFDEGEATDLLHAIHWVNLLGLVNVIFEMDSKLVVDKIKSPNHDVLS